MDDLEGWQQDVVIFGLTDYASVAWCALTHDSPYRVVAFTVNRAYRNTDSFHGLPVVDFEDLEHLFPPARVRLMTGLGWKEMGRMSARKYQEGRARGYGFVSHVSSRALTWPDLRIGQNTRLYDGVIVQPFARIGDNCVMHWGGLVSHHAVLGDHCVVAAQAVIAGGVRVDSHCVIGVNATLLDGVHVATACFIGAGAMLTTDTEPNGIYLGNPAQRRGESSAI